MASFDGKIATVTGASRGIGKGCALELGAAGATVYVTGRTLKEGLEPGQWKPGVDGRRDRSSLPPRIDDTRSEMVRDPE